MIFRVTTGGKLKAVLDLARHMQIYATAVQDHTALGREEGGQLHLLDLKP